MGGNVPDVFSTPKRNPQFCCCHFLQMSNRYHQNIRVCCPCPKEDLVQPRSCKIICIQSVSSCEQGCKEPLLLRGQHWTLSPIVVMSCFPASYCFSKRYLAMKSKRCVLLPLSHKKPFHLPGNWTDGKTILLEPQPLLSLADARRLSFLYISQIMSTDFEVSNVKIIRYQFWCTRCAFRLIKSLQRCSDRKSSKSQKMWSMWKSRYKPNRVPWNWAKSVEG
jgi:hypothetical protein